MRFALLLLLVVAAPAGAQVVVTTAAPERVGVTVYRDQNRGEARLNLRWLNGYALISETRTVAFPAGESDVRFEGVASGIVPQSAIIGGIPDGLLERNRDALLLSAGSLVDRALGQRVSLRRTDRATGKVSEQEAVVRSGSDGGVVLQTSAGFEALRCSGLSESLLFDRVPPGLSARPTLSVRVRARQPLTATVTLSYLATGFDWQADYVGILSPDERSLNLQAWLTLASTDDTSFVGAITQAVAGRINREAAEVPPVDAPALRLQCWPSGTTSDMDSAVPVNALSADSFGAPPPPMAVAERDEIIVTGSRMTAARERLGDLQLYRIPEPVTVSANAQKQVGLLDQPAVKVVPVYTMVLVAGRPGEATGRLELRSRNRREDGLGLPLPAGNLVLFRSGANRPLLIGEGRLDDVAVGEKVEVKVAASAEVRARLTVAPGDRSTLTLTNDRSLPVNVEVTLSQEDGDRIKAPGLVSRDGRLMWPVTVPTRGSAVLTYRFTRR